MPDTCSDQRYLPQLPERSISMLKVFGRAPSLTSMLQLMGSTLYQKMVVSPGEGFCDRSMKTDIIDALVFKGPICKRPLRHFGKYGDRLV
jgi:hypothetical protein